MLTNVKLGGTNEPACQRKTSGYVFLHIQWRTSFQEIFAVSTAKNNGFANIDLPAVWLSNSCIVRCEMTSRHSGPALTPSAGNVPNIDELLIFYFLFGFGFTPA